MEISSIAYPTQLRRSALPCESQVFDDCVMSRRTNLTFSGVCANRTFRILRELVLLPQGKLRHSADPGSSMGLSPVQYCTEKCVAYGSTQTIRMAFTGLTAPRSTTTHS